MFYYKARIYSSTTILGGYRMQKKRILLVLSVLGLMIVLTGCMKGEQSLKKVDIPEDVSVVDTDKEESEKEETNEDKEEVEDGEEATETEETVAREIYLFDEGGLVVPQELELPKTESAATQVLEYLVVDGPVTELLPNGFQAVLPAGTEVMGVNLKEDGTLIVDLSEEFSNYQAEDEVKILEAMTYTLTQFDSVDTIKLWVNGEHQTVMPVNDTPIAKGYSRGNGINIDLKSKPDLKYSEAMTMFYPKSYQEDIHFVPVTTYVNHEKTDDFTAMMQELLKGASIQYGTQQVFNDHTQLIKEPTLTDGVLQLVFSDAILKDKEKGVIADDVMTSVVKTLTTHEDVEAVAISVEDIPTIYAENGNMYEEPVTVQDVTGKEKM